METLAIHTEETEVEAKLILFSKLISHILPPKISKSVIFNKKNKLLLVLLEYAYREPLHELSMMGSEFFGLIAGLNGNASTTKMENSHFQNIFEFSVNTSFLECLEENMSRWGFMHPIQSIKLLWGKQRKVSILEIR